MDAHTILATTRGANKAVAQALGISDAAVSQWLKRGIPPKRRGEVEAVLREHMAKMSAAPTDRAA